MDSHEISLSEAEVEWVVTGTGTAGEALTQLLSDAPAIIDAGSGVALYRVAERVRLTEVVAQLDGVEAAYVGVVPYASNTLQPQEGDDELSFEIRGENTKITTSKETVSKTAVSGETAPDFKGLIGVTKDTVEGTDILVPVHSFRITRWLSDASVDAAYRNTLAGLCGRYNDATFYGHAAGEVLFIGVAGSQRRSSSRWQLVFEFLVIPNATDIAVGDITVPAKKGWDYLWVYYQDTKDASANMLVRRPFAAYVEKVYASDDFSNLGIGTS